MNLKCSIGCHKWSKPTFTKTKVIYECIRCHKNKIHYVPAKIILASELAEIAAHASVVGLLWATGHKDQANSYLTNWKDSTEKNKEL